MSTLRTEKCHKHSNYVISYYVRKNYEQKNKKNVPMALKDLINSFSNKVIPSKLITIKEDLEFTSRLLSQIEDINRFTKFKLIFTATEHGCKAKTFHNVCDRVRNTITIIKSNWGNVFGGYAEEAWMSEDAQTTMEETGKDVKVAKYLVHDKAAFLFLIRSNEKTINNRAPLIFPLSDCYFWDHYDAGPSWGRDGKSANLLICDDCDNVPSEDTFMANEALQQQSDFGPINSCGGKIRYSEVYDDCDGFVKQEDITYGFQVLEYQVFEIIFNKQ